MLKAEHITKQDQVSGDVKTVFDAVSDVSLELVNRGMTAIVGESGSGKSTLPESCPMWNGRTAGGCFWMAWRCPSADERNSAL